MNALFKLTLRAVFILLLTVLPSSFLMAQPGTQKWSFQTNGAVQGSPAIGPEGVIYAGSQDRNIYAINPDGTEKWAFTGDQPFLEPPVVGEDGTIYAADNQGNLCALNPDGSLKWIFTPAEVGPPSEMALAEDGTIYYAASQTYYAVNPDGSQFWTITRGAESSVTGISIGQDGVVLATTQGRLIALDPLTGAEKWIFIDGGGSSDMGPAVAEDGTIYFGQRAAGDNFFAVNPDGSLKWKVALDAQITAGPSIAANGDLYVPIDFKSTQGMNKGLLLALDSADGTELWRYETEPGGVGAVPAVGFDGTIYLATTAHKLIALRPDGSELWVFEPGGTNRTSRSSPTIAENGTLYYGSSEGQIYAVDSSSAGPAASSWPMARLDVRNTGRAGSDVARRRWFAPHVYWLDEENNAVVTISNTGERIDPGGTADLRRLQGLGATTSSFRIDVLNRDGSVSFSIEDSVEPGETKDIVLIAPGDALYAGSAIIDASVKDGTFLAPFLTWTLDVSAQLEPLAIGAFFSDPTDAAQLHHFPAEASESNGLGIGVQNIGKTTFLACWSFSMRTVPRRLRKRSISARKPRSSISSATWCWRGGGSLQGVEAFKGRGAFTCDAPVVAVAVNQDFANGGFPTDRITIKGVN